MLRDKRVAHILRRCTLNIDAVESLYIEVICLLQQRAIHTMLLGAPQQWSKKRFCLVWSIGPYIARERGIGLWVEALRDGKAGGSGIFGHGDTTGLCNISDLLRYFCPTGTQTSIFANSADGQARLGIDDGERYQKELLHPHAPLDVVYQRGFNASDFEGIDYRKQPGTMLDRQEKLRYTWLDIDHARRDDIGPNI